MSVNFEKLLYVCETLKETGVMTYQAQLLYRIRGRTRNLQRRQHSMTSDPATTDSGLFQAWQWTCGHGIIAIEVLVYNVSVPYMDWSQWPLTVEMACEQRTFVQFVHRHKIGLVLFCHLLRQTFFVHVQRACQPFWIAARSPGFFHICIYDPSETGMNSS